MKIDGSCTPSIPPPAATRECILLDLKNVGRLLRGVAIDGRGDAWVGAYLDGEVIRLDGRTGRILKKVKLVPDAAPYGLAIDPDGNPWVASRDGSAAVLRIDPTLGEVDFYLTKQDTGGLLPYGIAVDADGDLWFGTYGGRILHVDAASGDATAYSVGSTTRGVAVDEAGVLWVADSGLGKLHRVDRATGLVIASIPVGPGPVGVAVDHDGFVWSANQGGDSITRVKPDGQVVDTYPVGKGPYTYSDMTGSAFRIFRRMKGRFTGIYDVGAEGARWTGVVRDARLPAPSGMSLRMRAADTEAALLLSAWMDVTFAGDAAAIALRGRMVEVEVSLATDDRLAIPSVRALRMTVESP
jgi:DNA-binding beta-propeller fold protein YncE